MSTVLIAQISDTHICAEGRPLYGRIDTAGLLASAIDRIEGLRPAPDCVLLTGDLANTGGPEEYKALRQILSRLTRPFYVLPGNHDRRETFAQAFSDHRYLGGEDGFLHYVLDLGQARLIALDTVVPGEDGGLLCERRLDWLARRLGEARGRPTIIAMHHPPVAIGIDWLDETRCANADALAQIVVRHPEVERILCGHVHRAAQARFAGTVVATAPSTGYQVALEIGHAGEPHWVTEPPGFLLHWWREEAPLLTHVVPTASFGRPQPYG